MTNTPTPEEEKKCECHCHYFLPEHMKTCIMICSHCPPTPDKLAEARELLEEFKSALEIKPDQSFIYSLKSIEQLLAAQSFVSRAKQKKEILSRIKLEHDKYCGKLEKNDDWFEIAKAKLSNP